MDTVAERGAEAAPARVVERAISQAVDHTWRTDVPGGAALRARS